MVNFDGDVEHEDDFEMGWEWIEQDEGAMVAPYSGFRQCLLDPTKTKPEDFFKALFNRQMYTIMAEETNKYANRKIERGKLCTRFIYGTRNFTLHTYYMACDCTEPVAIASA